LFFSYNTTATSDFFFGQLGHLNIFFKKIPAPTPLPDKKMVVALYGRSLSLKKEI
jgi:hypothetical protein